MTINHKPTGMSLSLPKGIFFGGLVSMMLTLLLSAAAAKIIEKGLLQESTVGYFIMLIILLASFCGNLTATQRIKRRLVQITLISGAVYLCSLLAITSLFFGGKYESIGIIAILILAGGFAACLLQNQNLSRRKRKKRS